MSSHVFYICISLVIPLILHYFLNNYEQLFNRKSGSLVVAILSARENFIQRDVIRNTWIKHIDNNKAKYFFIVGNQSCSIPKDFRNNEYGCKEQHINLTEVGEENLVHYTHVLSPISNVSPTFYKGFGFKVHHPILIQRIGILTELVELSPTVYLLNAFTKEVIVKTSFTQPGVELDGYSYRPIETYLLPKNFECLLVYESPNPLSNISFSSSSIYKTGGGVISISKSIFDESLHPEPYQLFHFHVTSLGFSVLELNKLKEHQNQRANKFLSIENLSEETNEKLVQEINKFNDIVEVEVLDVYHHLPLKMLEFYKSFLKTFGKFDYLLKTDDDTSINLQAVLQELKAYSPDKTWIWSSFRRFWPVNYCGKWTDLDYRSVSYPPFPCGAGYVMSYPLVSWIINNAEYLAPYQGEDVSLGIWIAAINPEIIEDTRWSCDANCSSPCFNRAQLSVQQMRQSWESLQLCDNLFDCN